MNPDQFEIDDKLSELFSMLHRDGTIGAFGLAYGRVADVTPKFGTVIQSRYSQQILESKETRFTRILHGILRFGYNSTNMAGDGASNYLERTLQRQYNLAVIFSASSRRQIRDAVGKSLGGEPG